MSSLLISVLQLAIIFSAQSFGHSLGYHTAPITQIYIEKTSQKLMDKPAGVEIIVDSVNEGYDVPTDSNKSGYEWLGNAGPNTALALYYSTDKFRKTLVQEVPIPMQDGIIKAPVHLYNNDRVYNYTVIIEFRHVKHTQLREVENVFISAKLVPKAGK